MGKLTSGISAEVGDTRKFTFDKNKDFIIAEILMAPSVTLDWTWATGVCPHCKKRITKNITHEVNRIEILHDASKTLNNVKKDDIVLLADTVDGRKMVLPKEKYNEILAKSKLTELNLLVGGDE